MQTLTPKKGLGKKKEGEILRLQLFMSDAGVGPEELAKNTEVSAKTITHSLYESKPIGAKLLRQLHLIYGVSLDWLISGIGSMYLPGRGGVGESLGNYRASDPDKSPLLRDAEQWLMTASESERAWLVMEIRCKLAEANRLREGGAGW